MRDWLMRAFFGSLMIVGGGFLGSALADYLATQGAGSTFFAFTCQTTKICPGFVLMDSSATEKATAGNPLRTDPTGTTTQPVSGTVTTSPPANASTNVSQFGGTNVSTGTGVGGAGIPRVTVSSDSFPATVAVTQSTSPWVDNVTTWAGGTLGAMANYGTAPAAVLVPGVNAFITNVPAVSQSGPWTVQPGNTANTTPWLATISQGGNSATVSAGGALKVDGSAATQPVSGTVTANQGGAPWSENVTQFGGTNLSTGAGAGGAGIPRMTVSNDSSIKVWDGTNTAAAKAASTSVALTDPSFVVGLSPNPSTVCTGLKAISQTASTDLITSTNKLHICSILVVSATAQSVSLVEGTGSTCGTGTAAVMGATTAANGMALAANGGWSFAADRAVMQTQTTADHLCLLQSGAGNVSGFISYQDHA